MSSQRMPSQRMYHAASGKYYDLIGPDDNGNFTTEWVEASQSATADNSGNGKRDSATGAADPNMIPPAPEGIRNNLSFKGAPERGWYNGLDPRYRVRTRGEAHDFFRKGRVFAMLYAETASETLARNATENTAITVGRFNENVYSQIRRFVVVEVNRDRHFVYACAITTYGGKGVMKHGCKASEHTIVYLRGSQPTRFAGEWEKGMTKDPIMIEPTEANEEMTEASRVRCGKIYSIEWNVKVRDIGMVCGRDRTKFLRYYKEERREGFDPDSDVYEEETQQQHHAIPPPSQPPYQHQQQSPNHQSQQPFYPQVPYGYTQTQQQPQYMTPPQQPSQYRQANYAPYPSQPYQQYPYR